MPRAVAVDPTSLSPAQVRALIAATARELTWGLPSASREMRAWRELAEKIPDAPIRADAVHALTYKRGHSDGAALFTILPRRREPQLLRVLVAYETIWDFLDNVSERHPTPENGQQLHLALVEALDPGGPLADYYRFHPWRDDGGYLAALVTTCRNACQALPAFRLVRETIAREARRGAVCGLNHETDPARRDAALKAWAAREYPHECELSWFELSGGASASLVIHVLLTLATDPGLTDRDVEAAYAAHWPWIALATTMLDSYADQAEDEASGNHSYIAHYRDRETAIRRLRQSIGLATQRARALNDGERHAVIVGCMIAMYLSKDSARTPELRATTASLATAGGSLVRVLVPILRIWRLVYGQRSA